MEKGDVQKSKCQESTLNILELMQSLDHINDIVQYKAAIYERLVQYVGQTVAIIVFTENTESVNKTWKDCVVNKQDDGQKASVTKKEDDYPEELNPFSSDDEDEGEGAEEIKTNEDEIKTNEDEIKTNDDEIKTPDDEIKTNEDNNQSKSVESTRVEKKDTATKQKKDDDYPEELNPFGSDDDEEDACDEKDEDQICSVKESNCEKTKDSSHDEQKNPESTDKDAKEDKKEERTETDGNIQKSQKRVAPSRPPMLPQKRDQERDTSNQDSHTVPKDNANQPKSVPPKRPPPPTRPSPPKRPSPPRTSANCAVEPKPRKQSTPIRSFGKGILNLFGLRKKGRGH